MRVGHRTYGVTVLVAAIAALALAGGVSTAGAATSENDSAEQAGAGTAAAPDPLEKAREAMHKARQALNKARFAVNQNRMTRRTANQALALAQAAQSAAAEAAADAAAAAQQAANALAVAQGAAADAEGANSRIDAAEIISDTEAGIVSTTNELDYDALGGPAVTATVPASGQIEVWASVNFDDPSDGLVALYEDGQRVVIRGQDGLCGSGNIEDSLLTASFGPSFSGDGITLSTPPVFAAAGCGTFGAAPAPVLLERPPGQHTYELRYADCGCDPGAAAFSQRMLKVAGRP